MKENFQQFFLQNIFFTESSKILEIQKYGMILENLKNKQGKKWFFWIFGDINFALFDSEAEKK